MPEDPNENESEVWVRVPVTIYKGGAMILRNHVGTLEDPDTGEKAGQFSTAIPDGSPVIEMGDTWYVFPMRSLIAAANNLGPKEIESVEAVKEGE